MKPNDLLKAATELPGKYGLEAYRDAIFVLRNKGLSWREIADFLIEKGVKTDHSRIFRYMMEGNPLFDAGDSAVSIGGQWYESQKGRPLRPYHRGLSISIREKLKCILLEHPERVFSTWCQCQFRLSGAPNRIWLKQLHDELHAEFDPEFPYHLQSKLGFDLKFEGDVMALDCHEFNLKTNFKQVHDGIARATKFCVDHKGKWTDLSQTNAFRNKKILDLYSNAGGASDDEILEEHQEDYAKKSERLEAEFNALSLEFNLIGNR